jgi:transposase InsO family protein
MSKHRGDDDVDDDDDETETENFYRAYYTPRLPSSYGGPDRLRRGDGVKKRSIASAREWLSGQDAYTLHKPIRYRFRRRKTVVAGPGEQLQADLIDVRRHARDNDGYGWILTAVDAFSRKAYVAPLKDKSGAEVAKALSTILLTASPKRLQTDKGKEFLNINVRRALDRFGVEHFTSENENVKAALVERFNRTLRNVLHRLYTKTGRERFVDALPDIVAAYNDRVHRALGVSPNEVGATADEDLWLRLYDPLEYFEKRRKSLSPGDPVRISKARTAFQRGFTANWSREVFYVERVLSTTPTTYRIRDWNGESVRGSFYAEELQKIREPEDYRIERVLERKKIRGRKMALVKWLGYPDEFNQWINESDIEDVSVMD